MLGRILSDSDARYKQATPGAHGTCATPLFCRTGLVILRSSAPHVHQYSHMSALQFIVQGNQRLSGTIRPSGNKNAALPIVCSALLTDQPVVLENVPRIRDVETLVELIATLGVDVTWAERNTLHIHAKNLEQAHLDPELCR